MIIRLAPVNHIFFITSTKARRLMLQWEVRLHLLARLKGQPKDRSSTTQPIIKESVGLKSDFFLTPVRSPPEPEASATSRRQE
jgi:hypothetical protein